MSGVQTDSIEVAPRDGGGDLSRRDFLRRMGMIVPVAILAGSALPPFVAEGTRMSTGDTQITDYLGRSIDVPQPDRLEHVAFLDESSELLSIALAPEIISGLMQSSSSEQARSYFPPALGSTAVHPEISADGTSKQWLESTNTQLILSLHTYGKNSEHTQLLDELQAYLGIPVICYGGHFDQIPNTLRRMGRLFGRGARSQTAASYCQDVIDNLASVRARLSDDTAKRVLFVMDDKGTQAASFKEPYAYSLHFAGALNAIPEPAEAENVGYESNDATLIPGQNGYSVAEYAGLGMSPDFIVAPPGFVEQLDKMRAGKDASSSLDSTLAEYYASLDAVRSGAYRAVPMTPFNWLTDPNGVNCLLGMEWMCDLLYPELISLDMEQAVRDYFKNVFAVDLSDEQVRALSL
ncbi:MAG: hypothetical protein ACOX69_00520 [Coriobacteriales bacterium]|jgi:iron complex transport system substrate-binding protein